MIQLSYGILEKSKTNKNKMKKTHILILDAIKAELTRDPSLRFGQALFNLQINLFVNPKSPESSDYRMRDIHSDTDEEILKRIQERLQGR